MKGRNGKSMVMEKEFATCRGMKRRLYTLDTISGFSVCLKLFRTHSGYIHHETFSLMISLPAMPFGDRFCFSRNDGIGEMEGCTQRVQTAWPRLGLSLEATWLALGGPFLFFLVKMELETSDLTL